jgi:hypothetical protein
MAQMPRPAYYFALGAPGQWWGIRKRNRVAPTSSGRAKSSPQQTRMLRLLYTTSIVFRATQRWKREQAYDDPFRHPRD